MRLLSWNVQWCRGLDGRVDPSRIAREIRRMGDFDVVCLQEIADNFPDPLLAGSRGENQFAVLGELFDGYARVEGVAVDHPGDAGARRRFGNLLLTRFPLRQVFRHFLPYPGDRGVRTMPRLAIEAVIAAPFGELRVITTHLEYHSALQRMAQVETLRTLYADGYGHSQDAPVSDDGSPFHSFRRPAMALLAGDFNMPATDAAYARLVAPFGGAVPSLANAWSLAHPQVLQPPTFCVHQPYAPGMLPYACDFALVNAPLGAHVRDIAVDGDTRASDHQPLVVWLE